MDKYVELLIAGIALIVWLVRGEGRTTKALELATEAKLGVEQAKHNHTEVNEKLLLRLTSMEISLARLEGALGVKKEGI